LRRRREDDEEEKEEEALFARSKVTGLDLQPDGLTAGLSGHCQPDKNIHSLRKKKK